MEKDKDKDKEGSFIRNAVKGAATIALATIGALVVFGASVGINTAKDSYIDNKIKNKEVDNDEFILPAVGMQKHGLSGLSISEKFKGACSDATVTETRRKFDGDIEVVITIPVDKCRVKNAPKYKSN